MIAINGRIKPAGNYFTIDGGVFPGKTFNIRTIDFYEFTRVFTYIDRVKRFLMFH